MGVRQITSFRNEYAFLSNFYEHDGRITAEHLFQSMKCAVPWWQLYILDAPNPAEAKKRGRQAPMREDWEDIKLRVMESILLMKFRPGSEMLTRLLSTGDAELIEGNWWGDKYWGVCDGTGFNHLGKLLMAIRYSYGEGRQDYIGD